MLLTEQNKNASYSSTSNDMVIVIVIVLSNSSNTTGRLWWLVVWGLNKCPYLNKGLIITNKKGNPHLLVCGRCAQPLITVRRSSHTHTSGAW